jgi:S1-C subfamily serine protease
MIRGASIILTLLLHLLLIAALLIVRPVVKVPPPVPDTEEALVPIRMYSDGEHERLRLQGENGPAISDDPCGGRFYLGIGIIDGAGGFVLFVAPGAPADRAGIRSGEEILNVDILGQNRYPEGTRLTLQVASTSGERRAVELRVEKICNP